MIPLFERRQPRFTGARVEGGQASSRPSSVRSANRVALFIRRARAADIAHTYIESLEVNLLHLTEAILLAQAPAGGGAPAGGAPDGTGGILSMALPFLLIGLVFYFLMIRPQKREQQTRLEMLSALKKNDRVVTVGGIYGVVASVQADSDEVTLKIDENTNTKLRVTLSSIARVVGNEPDAEKASKAS